MKSKTGLKYKSNGIEGNLLSLFFAQLLIMPGCLEPLGNELLPLLF